MAIVAIVGIDGVGKTTQARILTHRLKREGYKAIYVQPDFALLNRVLWLRRLKDSPRLSPRRLRTAQPGCFPRCIMEKARGLLLGVLGYPYALITYMLLLFYSAQGKIVVCDRYFYQFFLDLYGNRSQNILKFLPKPDTTYYLHGNLITSYSRMKSSFDQTVPQSYYAEVDLLYTRMASKYNFIPIDTNRDKDSISNSIFDHFLKERKK